MEHPNHPILEVKNLQAWRGDTRILNGIDWRVGHGENWVILGSNGSGKTSLLQAITGYLTPSAGTIRLLGKNFGQADWRELREHVGIVSSSLRQKITGAETALETVVSGRKAMLNFHGKISREERETAHHWLAALRIDSLAERNWQVLSQGEQQRVLIARAMMSNPALLILDEPCAGLDPAARENFVAFLSRLARRNGAPGLVLVTHHVEEIPQGFAHVVLIKKGKVLGAGTLSEMLTGPLLSKVFGCHCEVVNSNGRHSLRVTPRRSGIA